MNYIQTRCVCLTYIRNVGEHFLTFRIISYFKRAFVIPLACARYQRFRSCATFERTLHVVASPPEFECVARVSSPLFASRARLVTDAGRTVDFA